MTDIDRAPRRAIVGIASVWGFAALLGVVVGIVVSDPMLRVQWLLSALGLCLLMAFALQLWRGQTHGFIERIAASMFGSVLVLSVISLGFALASIIPSA